jgi:hypothetical protein
MSETNLVRDESGKLVSRGRLVFKDLPGYPWLDPCPRCGYRGSCDCTVLERARAALPNLYLPPLINQV